MSLAPVTLPCISCGAVAVQIRPPVLPADVRGFLVPLVKLASLKYGAVLELPPSGNLFELVDPATLADWLELRCCLCAVDPADQLEAAANGD